MQSWLQSEREDFTSADIFWNVAYDAKMKSTKDKITSNMNVELRFCLLWFGVLFYIHDLLPESLQAKWF